MSDRVVALFLFALFPLVSMSEQPTMGPIIEDYGPAFLVEDKDIPLIEDFQYRVVFELAKYSPDTTSMNQQLVRVARFLNMHGQQGIGMENMDIAVVVHADALKSMLKHDAYQSKYQSENPNLDLVHKLADVGVKLYVCGQSMGFRQWPTSELAGPIEVGLSAMTLIANFQAQGYTFQP